MIRLIEIFLLLFTTTMLLGGCAAKRYSYDQQLFFEADSLFKVGNYEYAKVKFAKIRDAHTETDAARLAQFYLGYINVYYDNPFASWEAALREFKNFVTLYPRDIKTHEAQSWIRILVAMQSFEKEYQGSTYKLEQQKSRESKEKDQQQVQRKLLIESSSDQLKKCTDDRDSLSRKTRELENFILDLEKKCQAAATGGR
ncbi:MAG: hypothetical protein GX639_06860 [Fibrobacter sp.]|nr:hypothetical protein [Fibrobacter sp.]